MGSHHVEAEGAILLLAAHVLADGDLPVPLVADHHLRRVRAELLGADGPAFSTLDVRLELAGSGQGEGDVSGPNAATMRLKQALAACAGRRWDDQLQTSTDPKSRTGTAGGRGHYHLRPADVCCSLALPSRSWCRGATSTVELQEERTLSPYQRGLPFAI